MKEHGILLFPHMAIHLTVASIQHPYETLGHTTSLHAVLISYRRVFTSQSTSYWTSMEVWNKTDYTQPPHLRSLLLCLSLTHCTFLAQDFPNSLRLLVNLTLAFSSIDTDHSIYLFSVNTVTRHLYHVQSVTQYTIFILHNHPSLTLYKSFYIILLTYVYFQYVSLLCY